MVWITVATQNDNAQAGARGSLRMQKGEEKKHMQGTVKLLWRQGHPEFKFQVACSKVDGQPVAAGTMLDVILPSCRWEINQRTKPSKNGNHRALVIKVKFVPKENNLTLTLPIIGVNDEHQQLFYSALVFADQEQRRLQEDRRVPLPP